MANNKQSVIAAVICVSACAGAMAELPEHSILNHYGITPEQLPAAVAGEPVDPPPKSLFEIPAQGPWGELSQGAAVTPMTGNITIDRALEQEQARCLRFRDEARRRKSGWDGCSGHAFGPGTSTGTEFQPIN